MSIAGLPLLFSYYYFKYHMQLTCTLILKGGDSFLHLHLSLSPFPFPPLTYSSYAATVSFLLLSSYALGVIVCTGISAIKDSRALSWKSRFIASRRAIDQKLGDDLAVLFNSCTYTLSRSLYHFIGCARSKSISFVIHLIQIWLVLTDHFCSCNCLVT